MKKIIATVFALFLLWPTMASAQFSDSYNFLKAVRDRDGSKATDLLSKPGTVIVDTRDVSTGETALHIVVKRRDATWLAFLLARGAKADIRDRDGNTPLIAATQIGFVEAADMLLKRRAQVDATNGQGETALILAVQQRDLAMVRLLLASGANPARTDRAAGMSALDYARRDTRAAVILKLLEETKPAKPTAGPM
jgi:ankyrin repeat protein